MFGLLRHWQRKRLAKEHLPAAWREILANNVAPVAYLPRPLKEKLEACVRIFLDEKRFEGCGGLEVTETMRLTVAGYACLLLLDNPGGYYPQLGTVVLYPESFAAPIRTTDHLGVVTDTIEERLGESWQEGTVVLAWDSVLEILRGRSGDCNVIIHEFAHQIDNAQGITEGGRLQTTQDRYGDWEELLEKEQRQQRYARRRGRPGALDPYAFSSPQELFAVASETFFMRPIRLKSNHPDMYAELQAVYGLDPATWILGTEG